MQKISRQSGERRKENKKSNEVESIITSVKLRRILQAFFVVMCLRSFSN